MDIRQLQKQWDDLAGHDAMWAVLTGKKPGSWNPAEFYESGRREVGDVLARVRSLGAWRDSWTSALDFGCGLGRLSQALSEHFSQVTGVDISSNMVAQAEQANRHPDRCRYIVNGRNDLSIFESSAFDFVYSNIVLQHMPEVLSRGYIREFVRILKPGGLAVFQIPSEPSATLGGWIVRVTPVSWLRPVRKMDMYAIPRARVESLVAASGGAILDVDPDPHAGPRWNSYRYFVVSLAGRQAAR